MLDNVSLICGCDTFEVTTTKERAEKIKGLTVLAPLPPCQAHSEMLYRYKVNPDTVISGAGNNLTDFKKVLQIVKDCFCGADKLYISRFDFRFDDYINPYSRLYKLNRLLLSMLVTAYDVNNKYDSKDFMTDERLTVRFDHNDAATDTFIAAEYYNKARQEPSGEVKTRLELRTKQIQVPIDSICDYESFVLADWLQRINDIATADNLKATIARVSEGLIDNYYDTLAEHNNITEYFHSVRDSIYTTAQLTQLYGYLGKCSTAKSRAYNFRRKRQGIQFLDLASIEEYAELIQASAMRFLST